MLLQLFLLFTLMPLLELWLLFRLGGMFGFPTTITIVLLTGMAGAALARWQGWQAMNRIRSEMNQGMLPAQAIGDGAMILVAGVLLITPGVITDIVGLSLLIPPVRSVLKKGLQLWLSKQNFQVHTSYTNTNQTQPNDNIVEGRVIDAEVVDEESH